MPRKNQFREADGTPRASAPKPSNQFIKGTKTGHDESTKDKQRAEALMAHMAKFAKGKDKNKLSPAQVAAAKIVIERGKPALQAIQIEEKNVLDQMSPEELQAQMVASFRAHSLDGQCEHVLALLRAADAQLWTLVKAEMEKA
jgi:hypothetical protein